MEGLNKLGGRFQAQHLFTNQGATLDAKGSTGDTSLLFICLYQKIELLEIGFVVMALGGAVTIAAQLRLDYLPKLNGTRVNGFGAPWTTANYNNLATGVTTLTYGVGATAAIYTPYSQSLNVFATGLVPTSVAPSGMNPTPGPAAFPTMLFGDACVWNIITSGTGAGAQTIRPYIKYREMPLT